MLTHKFFHGTGKFVRYNQVFVITEFITRFNCIQFVKADLGFKEQYEGN